MNDEMIKGEVVEYQRGYLSSVVLTRYSDHRSIGSAFNILDVAKSLDSFLRCLQRAVRRVVRHVQKIYSFCRLKFTQRE